MAAELSGIEDVDLQRLRTLIQRAGLPTTAPHIEPEDWMAAMSMDKKVLKKRLRFVLLRELGDAHSTPNFDVERLQRIVGANA